MSKSRLSSVLLLCLLLALVLLPCVSWVLSMLGVPIVNLMSEKGLRWLMMNGQYVMVPAFFGLFLLAIMAVGAMVSSGFLQSFAGRTTMLQQRALMLALLFLGAVVCVFLFLVFWPQSPFLSVVGVFKHSPLIHGMPAMALLSVVVASLIYGLYSRTLQGMNQIRLALTYGFTHYGYWILVVLLANFLYRAICFALS